MEKRSTFGFASPFFVKLVIPTFIAVVHIPIVTLYMWMWNPAGLIVNRNIITATACTSDGSTCGLVTWRGVGRTLWNYNTDEVGVFYSVVPAISIVGLALMLYWGLTYISDRVFEKIKYREEDLVSLSPWPFEKISSHAQHEPYVSDDPQHEVKPKDR